jgi:hypothetical protein
LPKHVTLFYLTFFHSCLKAPDPTKENKPRKPRRRSTFDGGLEGTSDNGKKGKAYGNMAQQFNLMQAKMLAFQNGQLAELRDTIGCESVQILFFNDQSRELMMCYDEKWYRVASETGLEGWCIVTGETMRLEDAYMDHRFNEYAYFHRCSHPTRTYSTTCIVLVFLGIWTE